MPAPRLVRLSLRPWSRENDSSARVSTKASPLETGQHSASSQCAKGTKIEKACMQLGATTVPPTRRSAAVY